jgi:hypothetical protein
VRHRSVTAIENHVRVADGCEISGAIDQQQRDARSTFEKKMDQPPGRIAAMGMDEDATGEGCVSSSGQIHRFLGIAGSGNIVVMEPECEGDRRKQGLVGAVKQNGCLYSHL